MKRFLIDGFTFSHTFRAFWNDAGCGTNTSKTWADDHSPTNKSTGGSLGSLCQYPWRTHLSYSDSGLDNSATLAASC